MKENMTFGEYIQECELFEYSKEYFDLVKEAGEITLMGLYLDSQDFMTENAEFLPEAVKTTLLCESATPNESMVQAYEEKTTAFYESVGSWFKGIWAAIIRFFKRIANVFTASQDKRIEALEEQLGTARDFGNWNVDQVKEVLAQREKEIASLTASNEGLKSRLDDVQAQKNAGDQASAAKSVKLREQHAQIVALEGERTKVYAALDRLEHLAEDKGVSKELAAAAKEAKKYATKRVKVHGLEIIFKMGDICKEMTDLLQRYNAGMGRGGDSKDALTAIKKLASKVAKARKTSINYVFSSKVIDDQIKLMEDSQSDFNTAINSLGKGATESNFDHADTKYRDNTKKEARDKMSDVGRLWYDHSKADAPQGSMHELLKEIKTGSADVMAQLKAFVDKREAAIKLVESLTKYQAELRKTS